MNDRFSNLSIGYLNWTDLVSWFKENVHSDQPSWHTRNLWLTKPRDSLPPPTGHDPSPISHLRHALSTVCAPLSPLSAPSSHHPTLLALPSPTVCPMLMSPRPTAINSDLESELSRWPPVVSDLLTCSRPHLGPHTPCRIPQAVSRWSRARGPALPLVLLHPMWHRVYPGKCSVQLSLGENYFYRNQCLINPSIEISNNRNATTCGRSYGV